MERQIFTITNPTGLHARPANVFAKTAKKYACDVKIEAGGKAINGKSIVSVLSAGIIQGAQIVLITEGEDEHGAMQELGDFLRSGCGELG